MAPVVVLVEGAAVEVAEWAWDLAGWDLVAVLQVRDFQLLQNPADHHAKVKKVVHAEKVGLLMVAHPQVNKLKKVHDVAKVLAVKGLEVSVVLVLAALEAAPVVEVLTSIR